MKITDINRTIEKEQLKENKLGAVLKITAVTIYEAYPKRVGKKKALVSIRLALRKVEELEESRNAAGWLLNRVEKYAASVANQDRNYIPNPARWFDEERYNDEYSCKRIHKPESPPWQQIGSNEYYTKRQA